MTEETKIALSPKELDLVCNTDWILTKHAVIAKVYQLLGNIAEKMETVTRACELPLPVPETQTPKISRGENYRQLPYVMLDYPRLFGKTETLAIRTMFWWGNFFSLTLQLAGSYKLQAMPAILANFDDLARRNYWVCINDYQWEHHFGDDNYVPLTSLTEVKFTEIIMRQDFLKMAIKCPLTSWEAVPNFIEKSFKEMIDLIKISYQDGEKGLSPGIPITDFDL